MKQPVTVELFYDAAWQAAPVYTRDDVTITHGRADAYSNGQTAECRLTLDNRTGAYHPRNANSPLYGKIGRNTPLRVRLGASDVRFVGEVAQWKPDQSEGFTPNDVRGDAWVSVIVAGVSRRLGQGATPLKSSPYRYVMQLAPSGSNVPPAAYWPLDDMTRAEFGRPAIGGYPFTMRRKGSSAIKPAEGELAPWLSNGVQVDETTLGTVLDGVVTKQVAAAKVDLDVVYAGDKLGLFSFSAYSGDGLQIWRVRFDPATSQISLRYRADGESSSESVLATATVAGAFDGAMHAARLHLNAGSDPDYSVALDAVTVISGTQVGVSSFAGASKVRLAGTTGGGSTEVHYGHVVAWLSGAAETVYPAADFVDAVLGHPGEAAGRRIERLCGENAVTFSSSGVLDDSMPVGPQYTDTLLDVLRDAADTDLGILYDKLDALGLHYRTRGNLYNRAAALTLSFAGRQVAPPLEPTVDDLDVRNDVTVTRRDGSSSRAILATGRLSTAAPPAGVGIYDNQVTVNTAGEGKFIEDQAGWRLHLGTVDDDRFPRVSVDLDANPELAATVAALRVGDRLALTNLPDLVSVDDAALVIQGWSETIGSHRRVITFNCTPAAPWQVAVYQSGPGATVHKYDSGGSTLAALVTAGATTLSVAIGAGHPLWTTAGGEMGFDVGCEGERMTVTGISGGSSPQTFTVTRSVNGVVKGHPAAAAIRLWQTPVYAL